MAASDIPHQRLLNQRIARPDFKTPADVVGWLCAVQAQDFAGAKWALGLRMKQAVDGLVEQAFDQGAILRTHMMRPTWHFVTPDDIRWMLDLTSPRVHAANAFMYRRLELDTALFRRTNAVLVKALQGGRHLTREALAGALEKARVSKPEGLRLGYIMMRAELDGLVCSGPRRGKQFTYALLDERAPAAKSMARGEALAELSRRYFLSRGPATVHDFARWSGLTLRDARLGLEAVRPQLRGETVDGQDYWFPGSAPAAKASAPKAYLLSIYDEYVSGYKDRSAIGDAEVAARLGALGNALTYIIVLDGRIVGTWRRMLDRDSVTVETNVFHPPTKAGQRAIAAAARQYGRFLERPVVLV